MDNVPSSVSGTGMNTISWRSVKRVENWTGLSIGSVGIDEKYSQVLVDFTVADVLGHMETLGADVAEFKLGDFSEKGGAESNTSTARLYFENKAMEGLKLLGRNSNYFKANG